ncbi:MAG: efflux RND transporter permease subunit, partial [Mesorhizobium sp.]
LVTLGEALVLVVAVVFIFLQSWRTTIIPTIAIPVSLVATLVVMYMFGFSLNMLSLLGMVLAIGLVVDDAIVVVENVERQLEAGLKPLAATREDQGYFFVVIQLPDGASLERTDAVARKARAILQNTPGVDIVGSISGLNFLTNAAQSNSAVEFAILKPWDERGPDQSASKLVADVRSKLMELPE